MTCRTFLCLDGEAQCILFRLRPFRFFGLIKKEFIDRTYRISATNVITSVITSVITLQWYCSVSTFLCTVFNVHLLFQDKSGAVFNIGAGHDGIFIKHNKLDNLILFK